MPLKLGYKPPLKVGKLPLESVLAPFEVTVPNPNAASNSWACAASVKPNTTNSEINIFLTLIS